MAAGGLIGARRVAETMSHRVTEMNPGQGFAANFVTAGLVIGASGLGLPVSTTHVSCGTLFGIGAVTRQAHWKTIATILLAWVTTLPLAGALGAAFFLASRAASSPLRRRLRERSNGEIPSTLSNGDPFSESSTLSSEGSLQRSLSRCCRWTSFYSHAFSSR